MLFRINRSSVYLSLHIKGGYAYLKKVENVKGYLWIACIIKLYNHNTVSTTFIINPNLL